MKRLLKTALCLLLCALLPLPALAEDGEELTCGDYTYILLEGGGARITGYNGEDAELTVPDELDGHAVREIGESVFSFCRSLTTVILPDGLTSIGEGAFEDCPDDLTLIVSRDSYACQYAIDNGLTYTYPDANDWLYA